MKLLITILLGIATCTTASGITSSTNQRLRKTSADPCRGLSSDVIPWAVGEGPIVVSSFEELTAAIAEAINPSLPAKIRLCPGSITFDNNVDLSDKYFNMYCEKGGGEDDEECIFDMNGKSFVNNFTDGSDFSLEFEDVKIENGIAVSLLQYMNHPLPISSNMCMYDTIYRVRGMEGYCIHMQEVPSV